MKFVVKLSPKKQYEVYYEYYDEACAISAGSSRR